METIKDDWARDVCMIGQGADTCRYLMGGPDGMECAKDGGMRSVIDAQAARMKAKGDNCDGWRQRHEKN